MSWLYSASKHKTNFGLIIKEEGTIEQLNLRDSIYKDFFFVTSEGEKIYLTSYKRPKDGHIRDRSVFLENEDDEKAISLITANIEEDIKVLNKRIRYHKKLIKALRIEKEPTA